MDMTKDIIDYTQKHNIASDMAATLQNENEPLSGDESKLTARACPTPIDLNAEITPKSRSRESPFEAVSPKITAPKASQDLSPAPLSNAATESQQPVLSPPEITGRDITPPPRPLTSSELVGHSSALDQDPDLRIDVPLHKSRSLPASPQHHQPLRPLDAAAVQMAALFEFGQQQRRNVETPSSVAKISKASFSPTAAAKLEAGVATVPSFKRTAASAAAAATAGASGNQQFCLRWNNYQSNLTNVFDELLQNESFVDVTLACEGQSIKAHKMVLSACSPYFQALFYDNPCQHPIVIMRDVRWQELKAIMEFMYKGEINVSQDQINPLLKVAEMLKIRGLAEVSAGSHGVAAAHPMVPEQRMTVFDEEDDEDVPGADAEEDEPDDDEMSQKPKRARLLNAALEKLSSTATATALDLNLSAQRQRKRSRDGLFIDDNLERFPVRRRSRSPSTPQSQSARVGDNAENTTGTTGGDAMSTPPPVAMTTSTIVRNPFASPNPSSTGPQQQTSSSSATNSTTAPTSSSSGASTTSSSSAAANSAAASHRGAASSCSPPLPSAHSANGSLSSPSSGGSSLHTLQQHTHAHPAAAAAAAAAMAVNPHHSHHPHHHHHHAAAAAQQLAAQHQLHAAAHSHAAMASALGASLAAAAVNAGGPSGAGAMGGGLGGGGSTTTITPAGAHHDDMEIKPEIAEMIREEERAKMIEGGHPWMGGASTSSVADSYQYQLQSMWQKCWNTNQQNLVQQLRFRERGPLKSWRPEAMAEAIFSVLKEGLSLSQAARKFDIPYPTFVLYANRVHNMLGPSLDGGTDPRPKARGRPQRILLGMWPEELIRSVIKAVVFRDYREIKDEMGAHAYANGQAHGQATFGGPGNTAVAAAAAANGYHNAAAKLAAQNVALAPPDSPSPLSTMTETLRRQIMSQQQQSPISQSINMYKSPAYLQRSEIEDQVSASAKQHAERRASDSLPDLSALGLMGIPGLNVLPTQSQRGTQMHPSAANYTRERERERERDRERERERDRERERERDRERERELKEAMQARQYTNQSRGSAASSSGSQKQAASAADSAAAGGSSYAQYKNKEHPNYAYNKRFLESLPPGIDLEAIANGLLQKSANKSPRFEDFFPTEFFGNAEGSTTGAAYPPARESPLMKIKLEHQTAAEVPHED